MAGSGGGSRRVRTSSCLCRGTADGDVGLAVATGDRDAGGCQGDQPLTGIGQWLRRNVLSGAGVQVGWDLVQD
jgi:hypothetical protein